MYFSIITGATSKNAHTSCVHAWINFTTSLWCKLFEDKFSV